MTRFNRPEDGAWDPSNPSDFYFVTTVSFDGASRLWRLHFNDPANPAAGGTISMLLDGSESGGTPERFHMLDNITVNGDDQLILQEDPGNQAYLARVRLYDVGSDTLTQIAEHDPARFAPPTPAPFNQDEESSGVDRRLRLARVAAAEVAAHPVRVGADDEQVGARARVAVAGAGGQHEHVAAPDVEPAPVWAAEDDRGGAGDDAQHLVRGGVEVVEGEDPVHPGVKPAVAREQPGTRVGRMRLRRRGRGAPAAASSGSRQRPRTGESPVGSRRVCRGVLLNDREGGDADAVGLEDDDAAGEIHLGQLLAPWARRTPRRFAMRIDL